MATTSQAQLSAGARAALESAPCPNGCGGAGVDLLLHEFGDYGVRLCRGCGLARLDPRLAEPGLAEFYEQGYFSGSREAGYDGYEADRPFHEKTFARRLKFIRRFKSSGKLLDIGCGLGFFLDVAQRGGFEAYGLDCSRYAVAAVRARFGDRVSQGFLAPGVFPEKFFDVVTMFDLFEHVYHPREFLLALDAILKDDGVAFVTTPNRRSLLARVSGRNWVSYKIPEHVFYYTPATLRRLCEPLFEIVAVRAEGQYCSLEFLAERLKTLSRPAGAGLLGAARLLGASGRAVYVNSGSMTAVLRKRARA